jgi:hypothetical protein
MEVQQQGSGLISRNPLRRRTWALNNYLLLPLRWALTTTWFLLLLAMVLVGTSFLVSSQTDAWHWFQRSGALMVSIGAILSTQRVLRLMFGRMIGDISARDCGKISNPPYLSNQVELQACLCGFALVAMGTMIWAYGDLLGCLIYWDMSCLD